VSRHSVFQVIADNKRRSHPARGWRFAMVLLAVAAGGCGSVASSTSSSSSLSAARATSAVASASCSSVATVAVSSGAATSTNRRAPVSSCVFVLADGRRFRCSGAAFGRSTPSSSTLEHAKACVPASRFTLSANVRAVAAKITAVRTCLTNKGLRVGGGPIFPQQGPNTPAGELITGGAFIAFYTDQLKAERLEPQVRQNAKRFGGQVVRNGAVTVLWIHPSASGSRDAVSGCAFG
jgi:hypothetical protein